MELVLKNTQEEVASILDAFSGYNFNKALVHQVTVAYAANSRQGTCAQKTRAEVSGSGKKPWRQKGTGRARSGSIRSPIWRSGGVIFAASPQDYSQKINKKMYRGALRSILSELIRQNRLIVVEDFLIKEPKTKLLAKKLEEMNLKKAVILTDKFNENLFLAARNMHMIEVYSVININPISLIKFNKVIITIAAIKHIETMLI